MKKTRAKIKDISMNVNVAALESASVRMRVFRMMSMTLGVLVLFYLLALGTMVWNIVERKSFEAEARNLSNEVSELELAYMNLSEKYDLSYSYSLGFQNVAKKDFAKSGRTASVGYGTNGTSLASNDI